MQYKQIADPPKIEVRSDSVSWDNREIDGKYKIVCEVDKHGKIKSCTVVPLFPPKKAR